MRTLYCTVTQKCGENSLMAGQIVPFLPRYFTQKIKVHFE